MKHESVSLVFQCFKGKAESNNKGTSRHTTVTMVAISNHEQQE